MAYDQELYGDTRAPRNSSSETDGRDERVRECIGVRGDMGQHGGAEHDSFDCDELVEMTFDIVPCLQRHAKVSESVDDP